MSACISAPPDNKSIQEINSALKELSEEIKVANTTSEKLNNRLFTLSIVTTILTIVQTISIIYDLYSKYGT